MSALSKLRVSLAQNANVAEQILTRDFKKSMLTDVHDKHPPKLQSTDLTPAQNGQSHKGEPTRNLKSGISSKKAHKKDKKNQRVVKIGEQFSGKKLSTKSSLQIQHPHTSHNLQQQPSQMLSTQHHLMKSSGYHSKKQHTAISTAKDRTHHENKKLDDERTFLRGIVAVGSEKHLKYNNLKKQLQK